MEKPNQKDALHYLKSGKYFWNSGIFIFTPNTILKEIEHHMPDVYKGLLKIENAMGQDHYSDVLRSVYQKFPSVSIDYGVMEKTSSPVLTIPGDKNPNSNFPSLTTDPDTETVAATEPG